MESHPTVAVWIRELALRHGERELLVCDDARISFAEAEASSARMARGLLAAGVSKGSRVGILAPNGPLWVQAWLATTRVGAVAVPLNTFFRARELAWILRHADVDTLLCVPRFLSHDYLERLEEVAPRLARARGPEILDPALPFLRRVFAAGGSDRAWTRDLAELEGSRSVDEALLRAAEANVTPADWMVVLYSSGSTADPKGAVHTHGAVLRHAARLAALRDLCAEDRVWSPMPFFWVGGFVFSLLTNVHVGATTLCQDVFEPGATLAFLERERATLAVGWPHFGKALAEHPSRPGRDLSALRGGNVPDLLPPEICPPQAERRANALGMTETCGPHTWGGEGTLSEALYGSFGHALPHLDHRIVDPGSGEPPPGDGVGEIQVRGESVMQGLYKVEREDAFTRDGFYPTGDAGRFDAEGVLWFQGRLGDMIKTGGANVTPSEIETVLASYPEVKEAYVVGVPDPERGQTVVASVVLRPGRETKPEELLARLRRDVAAYKVPRHLFLDSMETLPFTDSGKIDKRRLARLLEERIRTAGS